MVYTKKGFYFSTTVTVFLTRGWHRISEGLEIPMAYITVAVPLTVVIIFVHLIARLMGSPADPPADPN